MIKQLTVTVSLPRCKEIQKDSLMVKRDYRQYVSKTKSSSKKPRAHQLTEWMIPRFSCKCSLTSASHWGPILAVAAAAVLHKLNSCCLVQTALDRGKTSVHTLQISPGSCTTLRVPSHFQWPHIYLHEGCIHTWKVLWAQLCFVLEKGALGFLFARYSILFFIILRFFQAHGGIFLYEKWHLMF